MLVLISVVLFLSGVCSAAADQNDVTLLYENFNNGAGEYKFLVDPFNTSNPSYSRGSWSDSSGLDASGCLVVDLGGIDREEVIGMSGGWRLDFPVTYEKATITAILTYKLLMKPHYERTEYSIVAVKLDDGDELELNRLEGDGNGGKRHSTRWRRNTTVDFDGIIVGAGNHTLIAGAYNNMKERRNEATTLFLDEIYVMITEVVDGKYADDSPPVPQQSTAAPVGIPATDPPTIGPTEGHLTTAPSPQPTLSRAGKSPGRPTAIRRCPEASDGPDPVAYSLCLDLDIDPQDIGIFVGASQAWSSKIVGDLEDVAFPRGFVSDCGFFPDVVDDLYLCGKYSQIDDVGGILGSAGPQYVRNSDGLPVSGYMQFDEADIAELREEKLLRDVIEHEMGHVLGLGTIWVDMGITGTDKEDCPYLGVNANREWQALTGCSGPVPTELDGGQGTRCGHWDETCLQDEIMTGYLGDVPGRFSRLTIAALEDLGYVVPSNYDDVADPFTRDDVLDSCLCDNDPVRRELRERKAPALEAQRGRKGNIFSSKINGGRDGARKKFPLLSKAARARAEDYGMRIMLEAKKRDRAMGKVEGITFIGDRVISVFVKDGGKVHLLEVWNED